MLTKLTRENLTGIWHALIVPWDNHDELDEPAMRNEIRSYANSGLGGLYTGGTTGEFYAVDDVTFEKLTALTIEESHALKLPVQIGCTATSTRLVRQRVKVACRHGADGIQLALPYWLELKAQEAIQFLSDIEQVAQGTPLILYQTGRAKVKLNPQELAKAAGVVPTLIGTKDTGCELETLREMTLLTDLAIFGGDDDLVTRIGLGGKGGYCSCTGLNVGHIVAIYKSMIEGDIKEAQRLQEPVKRLVHEFMLPLHLKRGIWDSSLDRLMRTAGGGKVGLDCQLPYPSATLDDVQALRDWCSKNAPELLVGI